MVLEMDFQFCACGTDILRRIFVASDQVHDVLGPAMNMLFNRISSSCFGAHKKSVSFM